MNSVATVGDKSAYSPAASSDAERLQKRLAELLDSGKFAQYHFEKARAALADSDVAAARYQVAASLSHERTEQAVALKAEIKQRIKAR